MRIRSLFADSFASNTYLLIEGNEAIVVDPGMSVRTMRASLDAEGARCVGILLTHGHFDHILSLDTLRDAFPDATVYIHKDDADYLTDANKNAFAFFFGEGRVWRPADHRLTDGEIILLGESRIRVLHTPGHTPGSVCYLTPVGMITGDTLFSDNYGRYDLPGGNGATLFASLRSLCVYPADMIIYPGHGGTARLDEALRAIGLGT